MSKCTIEPMHPHDDLDAVVELEAIAFTNPWTREMIAWELANSDVSHFFVVRTPEHRVAAYCSFWLLFEELHINNLAVRPEYRRQGLARRLLAHVLAEGARRGARRATLEVRASNTAARRLYESAGFTMGGRRRDYYTAPREDALILWHDGLTPEPPRA